ncbi:MAG: M14 family metallopeptidase [Gammaproteobacteria bacterium]
MSSEKSIAEHFSVSYKEARSKFLQAAANANAQITSIAHPGKGPDGEDLYMDFACLGPEDAHAAIVLVSGTHGIEGFCGSGVQVNVLRDASVLDRFKNTKLIFLHGHNPYGFAWLRRVNEDNIDLNRNYVDFSEPQEANEAYLAVKNLVLPEQFNDDSEKAMSDWIEENGLDEYQKIILGGQRVDPNGVFFGGTNTTWSNRTVHDMLPKLTAKQRVVGMIDVHTGLGPYGHGDLIHAYPKGSKEYDNLREWYGDEMIGINAGEYGDVVAAVPRGPIVSSLDLVLPDKESYAFVIEFGTLEFERVIKSLRADNWLHIHGDVDSAEGKSMKDEMRACFYCESDKWRQMIWDRSLWSLEKMAAGLASQTG